MQVLLNKNTKRSKLIGVANVAQLSVLDFLDVSEGGLGTTSLDASDAVLTSNGTVVRSQSSIAFDGNVFSVHGNAIVSNSTSGRVGIRTNGSPGSRLTVEGNAAFGNLDVFDRSLRCSSAFVAKDLDGFRVPSASNASVLAEWHNKTYVRPGDWTFDLSEPRLTQSALGSGYVDAIGTDHDVVLMMPATLPGNIGIYDVLRKVFRSPPLFVDQAAGDPVAGACLLKNGKVLLATKTARFYVVDLADGTSAEASASLAVAALQGQADAYLSGGTRLPDGRVLFAPGTAPRACLYDPATGTVDLVGPSFASDPSRKFASAVLLLDGRVAFVPYDSDRMIVYDLTNDGVVDVQFPLDNPGVNPVAKFSSGILGPDGTSVLFLPKDLFYVLVLNPVTFGNTKVPVTLSGAVANGYSGGLLTPDGKVVLVPREAPNIVVLDLETRTRVEIPGQGGYGGQVLASDRTIVLAPRTATRVGLLGPYL